MNRVGPIREPFGEWLRRASLYSFIGFLSLTALLAIVAVLFRSFGEFEIKVILTTVTITLASICCLCCGAYIQVSGHRGLGLTGIGVALLAALLLAGLIWFEWDADFYLKTTAITSICAVAFAHGFALWIARPKPGHRWVQMAVSLTIYTLASCLCLMILFEHFEDLAWRGIAALSILAALGTLVIPILHRIARAEEKEKPEILVLTRDSDGYYTDRDGRLYELRELGSNKE